MLEELGLRQAAAAHSIAVAEVEAMAGDDTAAERILRAGYEAVTAVGDEHSAKNVAWRLGLALARQGRYDEAEPFVRIAERAEQRRLLGRRLVAGGPRAGRGASRQRGAQRGSWSRGAGADGRRSRRAACTPMRCSSRRRRCARPGWRTRPGRSSPRRRASRNGSGTSSRGAAREEAQRALTA